MDILSDRLYQLESMSDKKHISFFETERQAALYILSSNSKATAYNLNIENLHDLSLVDEITQSCKTIFL